MRTDMIHALTVDVEDAVNLAMRYFFARDMAPTYRVKENTLKLLDLFDFFHTKATFFILGEVAETYPELVREIANRGNELGIHGYSHTRYDKLNRKQVFSELKRAKQEVEDVSGQQVLGHRAPAFSINQENSWVLEVLVEAGLKYDSSIFPAGTGRYGWPGFQKDIRRISLRNGTEIIEAPMSTLSILNREFPVCGGGYLRIFPYGMNKFAMNKISGKRPVNMYMHPYEIDPPPFQDFYMDQVRKSSIKARLQLQAYWFNRKTVIPKLSKFLGAYEFDSLSKVIMSELNIRL
ncbi:MAG: DUF3473 domain-containing protein [Bacteroidales bacterium]|nr:DUF3473 domain-containing protein [Bacteroidales bacterium]